MIASLLSEILEKLHEISEFTGALATAVDEFRPLARRTNAVLNGSPGERVRAAMGRTLR